jgi:hypothetical protein
MATVRKRLLRAAGCMACRLHRCVRKRRFKQFATRKEATGF